MQLKVVHHGRTITTAMSFTIQKDYGSFVDVSLLVWQTLYPSRTTRIFLTKSLRNTPWKWNPAWYCWGLGYHNQKPLGNILVWASLACRLKLYRRLCFGSWSFRNRGAARIRFISYISAWRHDILPCLRTRVTWCDCFETPIDPETGSNYVFHSTNTSDSVSQLHD